MADNDRQLLNAIEGLYNRGKLVLPEVGALSPLEFTRILDSWQEGFGFRVAVVSEGGNAGNLALERRVGGGWVQAGIPPVPFLGTADYNSYRQTLATRPRTEYPTH